MKQAGGARRQPTVTFGGVGFTSTGVEAWAQTPWDKHAAEGRSGLGLRLKLDVRRGLGLLPELEGRHTRCFVLERVWKNGLSPLLSWRGLQEF